MACPMAVVQQRCQQRPLVELPHETGREAVFLLGRREVPPVFKRLAQRHRAQRLEIHVPRITRGVD
nr:hypothetical protein D3W47_08975 [Deinococcus sp. RM]